MHAFVKWVIIDSINGVLTIQTQIITWTNADLLFESK